MKPIIGISPSYQPDKDLYIVSSDHMKVIERTGGISYILPYHKEQNIDRIIQEIDGLYITGGPDVDPIYYNEEPHKDLGKVVPKRDQFEYMIIKEALKRNMPIFGVCRGCQILNIAAGGSLYQDIYAQNHQDLIQHRQKSPKGHPTHTVKISKESLLYRLVGEEVIRVNSRHHQAVKKIASSFQSSAVAKDGIIEAIESKEHTFVLGVQWHPENMAANKDKTSQKIFNGFIEACKHHIDED